ncbi:MAG: sulfatase-like hydrolase/transferase [Acidobacteria bacterium]|nr:sulfatase-like hydrolase/transferase [Acidobacteriota bacterium]
MSELRKKRLVAQDRREFLKTSTASAVALAAPGLLARSGTRIAGERPNILWITCEDMSPNLGCYGDDYAKTPVLDRLAAEGVRYDHAFASAPVCAPTRSGIITGVYACSQGTQNLRQEIPRSRLIPCYTEYLRKSGYYCTNNSKEDYNFRAPEAWDESSQTAHWRKRAPGQPFFSVFNIMDTHQGQVRYGQDELEKRNSKLPPKLRHDPAEAPIPPYYPDTLAVRVNMAAYYTQITLMDRLVGEILGQLEEDGLANDTIVFFYPDHGMGLPRGKKWLYDTGLRIPLIIRFPKKYQHLAPTPPGAVTIRLISTIDLAPTMLSLTGLPIPGYMQGSAFLGKAAAKPQAYVFGANHRVDEVVDRSLTVRDGRYRCIRNFFPHRPRMQFSWFSDVSPIRQEIRRLHREGKLDGHNAVLTADRMPAEELYDTQTDPHELANLANSPEHRATLERLRQRLYAWMVEIKDFGLLSESEMHQRARGMSPYDVARETDGFPVERLLEAAKLVGMGTEHRQQLVAYLRDSDSGVRWWGAVGLAALGADARPAEQALRVALEDDSGSVRVAAAEALCHCGAEREAVPALVKTLAAEDPFLQCDAALALQAVGEKAKPWLAQIRQARENIPIRRPKLGTQTSAGSDLYTPTNRYPNYMAANVYAAITHVIESLEGKWEPQALFEKVVREISG